MVKVGRRAPWNALFSAFQAVAGRSSPFQGAFQGRGLERFITVPTGTDQISSFALMSRRAYSVSLTNASERP